MIMTLKNVIYPYSNNPRISRQIIDTGDNELLLFDLRIASRDEAMVLAQSIAHSIKKCIGVNGFADSINFSIGVVENAQYYQDLDSMIMKAQEACMFAQHNGQEVYLYQKQAESLVEMDRYRDEVENLMRPNSIRYLFRPIFDVAKRRTLGYFQYVKAYNTPFTSFAEMSKYAAKVDMSKEFFAMIARYVIPKFASEKQESYWRLFMLVSLQDIDHMSEVLRQIPQTKDIHLVLVFNEQEINENSTHLELLNSSLKSLRTDGFELAMLMKDKNLLLDPSVYYNFDYFVAGSMMIGEIKKNNRIRLSIHSLIESLLKYHRPLRGRRRVRDRGQRRPGEAHRQEGNAEGLPALFRLPGRTEALLGRHDAQAASRPHHQGSGLGHAPEEHDRAQDDDAPEGVRGSRTHPCGSEAGSDHALRRFQEWQRRK